MRDNFLSRNLSMELIVEISDKEKRAIALCLKQFIDHFYDREIAMYNKLAGKHPDSDIDLSLNAAMRVAFLAACFSKMSPLLEKFDITNEQFACYIKEYYESIHKRDKWYYDQEFSDLGLPES